MALLDVADLVTRRPANGQGVELLPSFTWDSDLLDSGASLDTGWWFVVESAVPQEDAAIWDVAKWDEDTWSEDAWVDMTSAVEWVQTDRGGEGDVLARSDVGAMSLALANEDGRYDIDGTNPYTSPLYMGAGTLVRASLYEPVAGGVYTSNGWYPLFTGFIESWNEHHSGGNPRGVATRWVEVEAVETLSYLARVDEFAVSPIGAGQDPVERLNHLLDGVWTLPVVPFIPGTPDVTFNETGMGGNRLTELYVFADSIDADLRTSGHGWLFLIDKGLMPLMSFDGVFYHDVVFSDEFGLFDADDEVGDGLDLHIDYDADSIEVTNDDKMITNVINLASTGGTAQSFTDDLSIQRYQRRSYTRNDLIYQPSVETEAAEYIAERMLARGSVVDRPTFVSVTLDTVDHLVALAGAEPGMTTAIRRKLYESGEFSRRVTYRGVTIAALSHTVELHSGTYTWNTDVEFGVSTQYSKEVE